MTAREYWRNLKNNPYFYLLLLEIGYFIVCEIVHRMTNSPYPPTLKFVTEFSTDYNTSNACLGGAILAFILAPFGKKLRYSLLGLGLLLELYRWLNAPADMLWLGKVCLVGPGLFAVTTAALLVCLVCGFHQRRPEAIRTLEVFSLSTALFAIYISYLPANLEPSPVYDAFLLAADGTLGFQPAFLISSALFKSSALTSLMIFIYGYLPTWLLICQALTYRSAERNEQRQTSYIPAFAFAVIAMMGVQGYHFFPAIGTEAYCGSAIFPNGPIPAIAPNTQGNLVNPHPVMAPGYLSRNAMPSLHLSFIISALMPMFAQKRGWWLLYLFLTAGTFLSAFQVGHHWLCDFVVALPFVTACLGAAAHRQRLKVRLFTITGGLLASFGLMAIIKYHIHFVMHSANVFWCIALFVDLLSIIGLWSLVSARFAKPEKTVPPAAGEDCLQTESAQ